jgi:hypothetical protein
VPLKDLEKKAVSPGEPDSMNAVSIKEMRHPPRIA